MINTVLYYTIMENTETDDLSLQSSMFPSATKTHIITADDYGDFDTPPMLDYSTPHMVMGTNCDVMMMKPDKTPMDYPDMM